MAHPVDELITEHRLIERMLTVFEQRVLNETAEFPAEFVQTALEFFSVFADGCHHYKEEKVLFPALTASGLPLQGGPVGVMLAEHDIGRGCLRRIRGELDMARAGDSTAIAVIRNAARQYVQLLREHIWKEDNILFQMSRTRLGSTAELDQLVAGFAAENQAGAGKDLYQKYSALVQSLESPIAA